MSLGQSGAFAGWFRDHGQNAGDGFFQFKHGLVLNLKHPFGNHEMAGKKKNVKREFCSRFPFLKSDDQCADVSTRTCSSVDMPSRTRSSATMRSVRIPWPTAI